MAKLKFIFKKEQEGWTNLEGTDLAIDIYNGNSELYIGTKETRGLKELKEEVEKDLRKRTLLKQDEELEISEFDEYVIELEKGHDERIDSKVYDLCKLGYKAVEEGRTTLEELIYILEQWRCSECI